MLLSVVIPTKNRYDTLLPVIESILSIKSNDIEVLIHDNSDDNQEFISFLKEIKDHRLIYHYVKSSLSQTENSNEAVKKSSGKYVCFIGDDDGVMPNVVEVVKWMNNNRYLALKSYKPNYYWPGQQSNFLSREASGILKYKPWGEKNFHIVATKDALDYTLKHGGVSMKMLPCVYHGIVSREVLDVIYKKAGTFFPGPSPDMANAIALTQVLEFYVLVNYPVVVSGKSSKSIGGSGVLHQHVSRIEDVTHLPNHTALHWEQRIPKYWTGPTIWAESVIKALRVFGNERAIKKFNFAYLYAYLMVFHKKHAAQIFDGFEYKKNLKRTLMKINIFLYRVRVFLLNRIGLTKQINGVKDIKSAIEILSRNSW